MIIKIFVPTISSWITQSQKKRRITHRWKEEKWAKLYTYYKVLCGVFVCKAYKSTNSCLMSVVAPFSFLHFCITALNVVSSKDIYSFISFPCNVSFLDVRIFILKYILEIKNAFSFVFFFPLFAIVRWNCEKYEASFLLLLERNHIIAKLSSQLIASNSSQFRSGKKTLYFIHELLMSVACQGTFSTCDCFRSFLQKLSHFKFLND